MLAAVLRLKLTFGLAEVLRRRPILLLGIMPVNTLLGWALVIEPRHIKEELRVAATSFLIPWERGNFCKCLLAVDSLAI